MKFMLVLLITVCLVPMAQAQQFTFAGVEWNSTPDQVISRMTERGFRLVNRNNPIDHGGTSITFAGSLFDHNAEFLFAFYDAKLTRKIIMVKPPQGEALRAYASVVNAMEGNYGSPTQRVANFNRPYFFGDGYELQAIRLGQANIAAYWLGDIEAEDFQYALGVSIERNLSVVAVYETPRWGRLVRRVQEQQSSLF